MELLSNLEIGLSNSSSPHSRRAPLQGVQHVVPTAERRPLAGSPKTLRSLTDGRLLAASAFVCAQEASRAMTKLVGCGGLFRVIIPCATGACTVSTHSSEPAGRARRLSARAYSHGPLRC